MNEKSLTRRCTECGLKYEVKNPSRNINLLFCLKCIARERRYEHRRLARLRKNK